ncbi:MAG: FtsQ-type POTRA domain-containing protein, partial [Peptostreptococcaceae bacterium]|nr:FtsQ-type POTRA domain-containing protein [Peptostreptococcaceae bacterium]
MKKKIISGLCFLLFIFFICVYIFFFSGKFSVSKIQILGTLHSLTKNEIISMAKIDMTKNIYLLNSNEIKENIEKETYVEKAVVTKKFPREINIFITERTPVASIPIKRGGYVIIDENAKAIKIVQDIKNVKKPILKGIEIKDVKLQDIIQISGSVKANDNSNSETDENIRNLTKFIKQISALNFLDNISYMELKKLDDITLTTKSGILVKFGDINNSEYKCKLLNKILIDLTTKGKNSGTVD